MLANVSTATFKGRSTTGTGAPEDLTVAQAKNLLGISNVEDKSAATILAGITSSIVTTALGFTPVQQGGVNGQGTNKVYIGWSGTRLKAMVDSTDQGNFVFDSQLNTALAAKSDTSHTHSYLPLSGGALTGDLTIGNGTAASTIYMADSDEGSRTLHCNGNRIGFLNQSGAWGAWCEDNGNWTSDGYITGSEVKSLNWLRVGGGGGVYWDAYGRGLTAPDGTGGYGSVSTYGNGFNGWCGYNIHGWCSFMRSTWNSEYGIYNNGAGHWGINIQHNGDTTFVGNVGAYSDISLKTNIRTIDSALDKVKAMRGVLFDRIDTGEASSGVIAQELEKVAPELVHTNGEGIKSVAYGNIVGYLIEANKELATGLSNVATRLAAVEARQ
jgi:hypothetical protein